MKLRATDAALL